MMDTPSKRAKPSWWAEFKASREQTLSKRGIDRSNPEIKTLETAELYALSVFINDQVTKRFYPVPNLLKDAVVKPLVARILATDNALWATLFHRDFPEYDILYGDGKNRRDRIITAPPSWIGGVIRNGTDLEYDRVPWRRFYMWCVFFERMSLRILGQWVYNEASAWVADPNRSPEKLPGSGKPQGVIGTARDGFFALPLGQLDSFSNHPESMYLLRVTFGYNTYAATAYDILARNAYRVTNSRPEFVKLARASANWCNLERLASHAYVYGPQERGDTFIAQNFPKSATASLNPVTIDVMRSACMWSMSSATAAKIWEPFDLQKATTNSILTQLPSVPRIRVTRIDPGTGTEVEYDILYVAGRCAGDTCLNEPVGTSVIDGLHYCSKECQPIARHRVSQ